MNTTNPKPKSKTAIAREARAERTAQRLARKAKALSDHFEWKESVRKRKLAAEQARNERQYLRELAAREKEFIEDEPADPRETLQEITKRFQDAKRRYHWLKIDAKAAKEFDRPDDPDGQRAAGEARLAAQQAYKEYHGLSTSRRYYELKVQKWTNAMEFKNQLARQRFINERKTPPHCPTCEELKPEETLKYLWECETKQN